MKDAAISVIALATSHETVVSQTVGMDHLDARTIAAITGEADLIARTRVEVMTPTRHEGDMIVTDESAPGVEAATITTVMSVTINQILATAETGTSVEVVGIVVVEAMVEGTIHVEMNRGAVLATSIELPQETSNSSNKRTHKTLAATYKIVSG